MTTRIRTITVDCRDWRPLVAFWSALTDYVEDPENPNEDADDEGLLVPADGAGPALLFLPVPEGKTVKNRVHLDLEPLDRTRDETLEEVLRLGGSVVEDHRRPDGSGWVTVADPEGNELCIERSVAERAERTEPSAP
ncbi:VOC family protein [Angustibacter aerolatus]